MKQYSPPFLLRSLMFVPAHNERLLASAARSEADVLLLDLEDSVQTDEYKQIARNNIIARVQQNEFANYHIFPRVNDRESGQLFSSLTVLCIRKPKKVKIFILLINYWRQLNRNADMK